MNQLPWPTVTIQFGRGTVEKLLHLIGTELGHHDTKRDRREDVIYSI